MVLETGRMKEGVLPSSQANPQIDLMATKKLAQYDLDYSTLVKNISHLWPLGSFHSDLTWVYSNQILEADSQGAESQVACNPLLITAKSKTRQFVEFLREQSSSEDRTWGSSITQGSTAVSQRWFHGTTTSRDTESPFHLLILCLSHCRDHTMWEGNPE